MVSQTHSPRLHMLLLIVLPMVSFLAIFLWAASSESSLVRQMSLLVLVVIAVGYVVGTGVSIRLTNAAHSKLEAQILEQTHALHECLDRETHYRAIVEMAFDCIITTDSEGRVTEFNPAAEQAFGYRKEDALGRELAELIVPLRLRDAHRKGFARYANTGEGTMLGHLIEVTGMRADGSELPVEMAVSAFRTGESVMFTGVLRNIAERRRMEDTRLRAVATEEQDRQHREPIA